MATKSVCWQNYKVTFLSLEFLGGKVKKKKSSSLID